MPRYGFVIDLKRCYGCYACEMNCKAERLTPPGVAWARVLKGERGKYPAVVRQRGCHARVRTATRRLAWRTGLRPTSAWMDLSSYSQFTRARSVPGTDLFDYPFRFPHAV